MIENINKIETMTDETLALQILESRGNPGAHTIELAKRLLNLSIHVDATSGRVWAIDGRSNTDRNRPRRRIKNVTFAKS